MSRQQLPHHQPASQASCPTTYRTTRQPSRMSSLLPTNSSSSRRSRKGPWMCLSTLACCWPWVRFNIINIIKATTLAGIASFCCGSTSGNSITRIRILCNKSGKESLNFSCIIWNFLILKFSLIYDKVSLQNFSITVFSIFSTFKIRSGLSWNIPTGSAMHTYFN